MSEFPETRNTLIERLRDPDDRQAWMNFSSLYRPVIYRMAVRRGFQDADANDLTQNVLLSVSKSIDRWTFTEDGPRFRTWLSRVARNAIIDAFRRNRPDRARGGTSVQLALAEHPAENVPDEITFEYRRAVFRRAAQEIREEFEEATWSSFWLTSVESMSAADAARQLDRTVGSIYAARSRIIRRLEERVGKIDSE